MKGEAMNTDSDRPKLRMLAPEDAPPLVRMTDTIFEISQTFNEASRIFGSLGEQCERLFVSISDLAHGPPDDE